MQENVVTSLSLRQNTSCRVLNELESSDGLDGWKVQMMISLLLFTLQHNSALPFPAVIFSLNPSKVGHFA